MKNGFNLEKALKRMEQIATLLEDQEISLDDSIKLYKEATELAARSSEYITNAKLMVEEFSAGYASDKAKQKETE